MGKLGGIVRLVPLVVVLALVLSACSFSTDTVATVGGERITRGELNAAVEATRARAALTGEGADPSSVLSGLIGDRLRELAARDEKIAITADDIERQIADDKQAISAQLGARRAAQLDQLAGSTAGELLPVLTAYGSTLPPAELQMAVREEIERLRGVLAARGTTIQVGGDILPERAIKDQAIVFRNALAGKGVGVPPEVLEPYTAELVRGIVSGGFLASTEDDFTLALTSIPYSSSEYQQIVRQRALRQKLRTLWYKPQVQAVTLQRLLTDSQQKAQEAAQRGRAGTPFADLVKTYGLPTAQTQAPDGTIGSYPVEALTEDIANALKIEEGAISEPVAAGNGQFYVYRVAKVEMRAPNRADENVLEQFWLQGVVAKYPIVYVDRSLAPPGAQR